jgi:hypothetical protein
MWKRMLCALGPGAVLLGCSVAMSAPAGAQVPSAESLEQWIRRGYSLSVSAGRTPEAADEVRQVWGELGWSGAGFGFRTFSARRATPGASTDRGIESFAALMDYFDIELVELHTRVDGDIGLVWGVHTEDFRLKGRSPERIRVRFTNTLRWDGTGWRNLLYHRDAQPFDTAGWYVPAHATVRDSPAVRVVVTGHDEDAAAVVESDGAPLNTIAFANSGLRLVQLWGTAPGSRTPGAGARAVPVIDPFLPASGGSRFVLVEIPTREDDAKVMASAAAVEEFHRDFATRLPDLAAAHRDPGNPLMHRTESVDYIIVLSGEVELELDEGARVRLRPGNIVVQNGTNHAWHNVGRERAVLGAVLVGTSP